MSAVSPSPNRSHRGRLPAWTRPFANRGAGGEYWSAGRVVAIGPGTLCGGARSTSIREGPRPCWQAASVASISGSVRPRTCCARACMVCAQKIAPRADEIDRSNTFPRDCGPRSHARRARHHGRGGMGRARGSAISNIASPWRRFRGRPAAVGLSYGHIRTSASISFASTANAAQKRRYLRSSSPASMSARWRSRNPMRARRRRDAHARREAGRPLRAQRQQDVDHQRAACRHRRGLCPHRSQSEARASRLSWSRAAARVLAGAEARQARHARLRHLRAGVRGLRGTGGEYPGGLNEGWRC